MQVTPFNLESLAACRLGVRHDLKKSDQRFPILKTGLVAEINLLPDDRILQGSGNPAFETLCLWRQVKNGSLVAFSLGRNARGDGNTLVPLVHRDQGAYIDHACPLPAVGNLPRIKMNLLLGPEPVNLAVLAARQA